MPKTNLFAAPAGQSALAQNTTRPRIPPASGGIQYNFCKNPSCDHFGLEPPRKTQRGQLNPYVLSSAAKGMPLLKCKACGEMPPLKSNIGIDEELARISAYLEPKPVPACPNLDCENHAVPLGTKRAYRAFGTTAGGAHRYQCSQCRKTFAVSKPTHHQRDTYPNKSIFKLLINKVPFARIVSMLDISWHRFYHRIDFIHQQCLEFVADRERKLKDISFRRLYLAVDRQDYLVNWTEREDKRNVVLSAVASADNTSGYVLGIHPNFDSSLKREDVEAEAQALGDNQLAFPLRRHARLWLASDYAASTRRSARKPVSTSSTLHGVISETYHLTSQREDIEVFDVKTPTEKLPDYGLQVHAEYTMIAHFYFLKKLFGNVEGWRFFLDQESGIRSACLSAFQPEVAARTAEAFYVSITKDLTVDQKRQCKQTAMRRFGAMQAKHPGLKDWEIKLLMLKEEIAVVSQIGPWKDRWVNHPLPSMSEPEKAMCWLTEHDQFDEDHVAWLYGKASLHAVDVFFEKVRRRVSLFERSIHSSANNGRIWSGYAPYNPGMAEKLLTILRVAHNYIDVRKTKSGPTTPAMRLGLAQAPLQ
jgi:transposase-like protein